MTAPQTSGTPTFGQEFPRYFLVAAGLLMLVAMSHYFVNVETDRKTRETSERLNVELGKAAIANNLHNVVSDLMFLGRSKALQGHFERGVTDRRGTLAEEFMVFMTEKRIYDQIRLLDSGGDEKVRINFNAGDPVIIPASQLQNKAERYYFEKVLSLNQGEIYISPLDLNIEHGRIETPIKPMIRFGTPVFDRSGKKRGILLLNYLGETLLRDFRQSVANIGDHVMLLNAEGFWLSNPQRENEWGFMYNNNRSFERGHKAAWERIRDEESGQFKAGGGLYSFVTVHPEFAALGGVWSHDTSALEQPQNNHQIWKIVSHISPLVLTAAPGNFLRRHLPLYLSMLVLLTAGAALLALATVRHRQAEAEIVFERRFRNILEDVDLISISLDGNGKITFCNHSLLELAGWRRGDIMGKDWFELFVPEENRSRARKAFKDVFSGKTPPHGYTDEIQARNGDLHLIAWNQTLLKDPRDQTIGLTRIGDDITEARHAEDERRKLSQAIVQSPVTVMIVDKEGRIEYANPKFTSLTGYSLEEVKGKTPSILKSGKTSDREYRELWEKVIRGEEWRGVFQNKKKNGELYWEAASISPVRDESGEITHFLAVKEDITEKVRLENEVEEQNREIAQNQALAAVGRMSSMIAHDLRNPLSSIKMGLQMLKKRLADPVHEQEQELLAIALQQVGYTEELMSDLLAYSRPDALTPEWLEIDKLLGAAVIISQREIDTRGVKITTHYQPGLPTLHGDANKLRQTFSNLLVNAVQAAAELQKHNAEVILSTYLELGGEQTAIRIEICDNGKGIDPAQAKQLFEPFYTTRARGTGLGLAIVKRIVGQHAGSVTLEAAPNGGACASVVLPIGPVAQVNQPDAAQQLSLASSDRGVHE